MIIFIFLKFRLMVADSNIFKLYKRRFLLLASLWIVFKKIAAIFSDGNWLTFDLGEGCKKKHKKVDPGALEGGGSETMTRKSTFFIVFFYHVF